VIASSGLDLGVEPRGEEKDICCVEQVFYLHLLVGFTTMVLCVIYQNLRLLVLLLSTSLPTMKVDDIPTRD
jgi:cell division protein FtsL